MSELRKSKIDQRKTKTKILFAVFGMTFHTLTLQAQPMGQESYLEISQHRLALNDNDTSSGEPLAASPQIQSPPAVAQGLPNPNILTTKKERPNYPKEVRDNLYPITPTEIREIIGDIVERQGAATVPSHVEVRGTASQYLVDLSLGASPPVVRVIKGLGAMVNFVDAQGNPWPIVSATNFHEEAAKVEQMADHVLSVASSSPYLTGSVGVMLEGLNTPIHFMIVPATTERDFRVDLRIPRLSPNAKPIGSVVTKPSLSDGNIKDFLYGATPDGATRLKLSGEGVKQSNARAWQNNDGKLVIRTQARIISPSWVESEPALDGTTVYVMNSTPVVRVSVDGKESMFYIDGLKPVSTFSNK